ncbi:hypothetical protein GCM10010359_40750 [Streptomyces morookaense]|nr:hypothetical protein GCM10010359_40750 [Streptomyces morookaense]
MHNRPDLDGPARRRYRPVGAALGHRCPVVIDHREWEFGQASETIAAYRSARWIRWRRLPHQCRAASSRRGPGLVGYVRPMPLKADCLPDLGA